MKDDGIGKEGALASNGFGEPGYVWHIEEHVPCRC